MKKLRIPEAPSLSTEEVDTLITLLVKLKQPKEVALLHATMDFLLNCTEITLFERDLDGEEEARLVQVMAELKKALNTIGQPLPKIEEQAGIETAKNVIKQLIIKTGTESVFSGESEELFVERQRDAFQYWKYLYQNTPEMMAYIAHIEESFDLQYGKPENLANT